MKAIIHSRYGPPDEVLELAEVDTLPPQEDEVLVRVRAAGVGKGDWLVATGQPYIARPSYGLRVPSTGWPASRSQGSLRPWDRERRT